MFFVYILHSQSIDKFYVGQTSNVEDRLARHNRAGEKFTSVGQPWILVYLEEFDTKEKAIHRERQIKNWKSKKLIQQLINRAG